MTDQPNPQSGDNRLTQFLSLNPEVKLVPTDDFPIIREPWGDDSVVLRLNAESSELIKSLSSLRLLPRFSAVWHLNSKDIEFIYAPIPANDPLLQRTFVFRFAGNEYTCQFAKATNTVIDIAQSSRPSGPPSDTNYRNLGNIDTFLRREKRRQERRETTDFIVASFFIRNVQCEEDKLASLAKHLNFYMHYFDRRTPLIVIHESPIVEPSTERPIQFPFENFPQTISGSSVDPYLLSLWESSVNTTDTSRRFLYNFQIVEYAAFYYLRDGLSRNIKQVLASPDLPGKIEQASRQILDIMVEEKASDESKFNTVIQESVEPQMVWNEIQSKLRFFSVPTEFDGGCSIPALVAENWTLDIFKSSWLPKLPDSLRKLRNGLVHSRELRQAKCVLPTSHNLHLLRPWAALMSVIANQIIVYGNS